MPIQNPESSAYAANDASVGDLDGDGDGDPEVAVKTADATVSGTGQVIGNGSADHRNSSGYILTGPEFLTMFDGRTGAALSTVDYVPPPGDVLVVGRLVRQPRRPVPGRDGVPRRAAAGR